jgi:hypothetical protein
MKRSRLLLTLAGALVFGTAAVLFVNSDTACALGVSVTAGACQKCGDGYCARSCENERTCPRDCAPGGGTQTK